MAWFEKATHEYTVDSAREQCIPFYNRNVGWVRNALEARIVEDLPAFKGLHATLHAGLHCLAWVIARAFSNFYRGDQWTCIS